MSEESSCRIDLGDFYSIYGVVTLIAVILLLWYFVRSNLEVGGCDRSHGCPHNLHGHNHGCPHNLHGHCSCCRLHPEHVDVTAVSKPTQNVTDAGDVKDTKDGFRGRHGWRRGGWGGGWGGRGWGWGGPRVIYASPTYFNEPYTDPVYVEEGSYICELSATGKKCRLKVDVVPDEKKTKREGMFPIEDPAVLAFTPEFDGTNEYAPIPITAEGATPNYKLATGKYGDVPLSIYDLKDSMYKPEWNHDKGIFVPNTKTHFRHVYTPVESMYWDLATLDVEKGDPLLKASM